MLGFLSGIGAVVISTLAFAVVGALAGILAGYLLGKTYTTTDKTDFNGAKLIGLLSGIVLAVILGEYVVFTLSIFTIIGLVILMLEVIHLLIVDIMSASNSVRYRSTEHC